MRSARCANDVFANFSDPQQGIKYEKNSDGIDLGSSSAARK